MNTEILEVLEKIKEKHYEKIPYRLIDHPKLLICFSWIPASGKTYLSKCIEKRYKGLRITNDDIRGIIKNILTQYPSLYEKRQEILEYYVYGLLSSPLKNGLVILDSGIDRRYHEISQLAMKYGYKMFLIRILAREETLSTRIKKRSVEDQEHFKSEYPRWKQEYEEFNKKVSVDFSLKTGNRVSLQSLFKKIDALLAPW